MWSGSGFSSRDTACLLLRLPDAVLNAVFGGLFRHSALAHHSFERHAGLKTCVMVPAMFMS